MGDPHNTKRYGETWDQKKIDSYKEELAHFKDYVILSGGWAWHFMSPEGHVELKHAHDHKDMDIFVHPKRVGTVMGILLSRGFKKVATIHDNKPSKEEFRRYEKEVNGYRLTIDFFVRDINFTDVKGHFVVDPKILLTLYSNIHSSNNCFAVLAASKLIEEDVDVDIMDRKELVEIPHQ